MRAAGVVAGWHGTFTGWFHRIRIEAGLPRITLRNLRHSRWGA
jgi:hypothetical protein